MRNFRPMHGPQGSLVGARAASGLVACLLWASIGYAQPILKLFTFHVGSFSPGTTEKAVSSFLADLDTDAFVAWDQDDVKMRLRTELDAASMRVALNTLGVGDFVHTGPFKSTAPAPIPVTPGTSSGGTDVLDLRTAKQAWMIAHPLEYEQAKALLRNSERTR